MNRRALLRSAACALVSAVAAAYGLRPQPPKHVELRGPAWGESQLSQAMRDSQRWLYSTIERMKMKALIDFERDLLSGKYLW